MTHEFSQAIATQESAKTQVQLYSQIVQVTRESSASECDIAFEQYCICNSCTKAERKFTVSIPEAQVPQA